MEFAKTLLTRFIHSPSAIALVVANLIPLGSAVLFGWNAFDVVVLYWLENVVIGVINLLKMITYGAIGTLEKNGSAMHRVAQIFSMLWLAMFFAIHYGAFCYGHGFFIFTFLRNPPGEGVVEAVKSGPFPSHLLGNLQSVLNGGLWLALAGLVVSHSFSFVHNFILRREYLKVNSKLLMIAPYGRVVILHVAIIFGGFVVALLGSPLGAVLFLIVMKIILDVVLHLGEREKGAVSLAPIPQGNGKSTLRSATDNTMERRSSRNWE